MPRAFIILPQLVSAIFFYVDRLPKRCTVMYFLYFLTRTIASGTKIGVRLKCNVSIVSTGILNS